MRREQPNHSPFTDQEFPEPHRQWFDGSTFTVTVSDEPPWSRFCPSNSALWKSSRKSYEPFFLCNVGIGRRLRAGPGEWSVSGTPNADVSLSPEGVSGGALLWLGYLSVLECELVRVTSLRMVIKVVRNDDVQEGR
jgi:hypothetical protein